ncbi:MAG: DnaD domain protein [Chloroflexota bacterium]
MTTRLSKRAFPGFPAHGRFTPIHNVFFAAVLPEIEDLAELKVTLHLLWVLYEKKGYPRFVTRRQLLADAPLVQGMGSEGTPAAEALGQALELAVKRGTLLHLRLKRGDEDEDLYFLNTEADRRAVERIESGELQLADFAMPAAPPDGGVERRDIFSLYEANIGLLTPIIAEELKEAEKLYPVEWIEDAFREAVSLNKRSWRYIARILERWSTEGKDRGKSRQYTEKTDPDKYIRGKYGRLVRRR